MCLAVLPSTSQFYFNTFIPYEQTVENVCELLVQMVCANGLCKRWRNKTLLNCLQSLARQLCWDGCRVYSVSSIGFKGSKNTINSETSKKFSVYRADIPRIVANGILIGSVCTILQSSPYDEIGYTALHSIYLKRDFWAKCWFTAYKV